MYHSMLAAVKPIIEINRMEVKVKDMRTSGGKTAETDTDVNLGL